MEKRKKDSAENDELNSTKFMTMNDDCILEILSYLDGANLCNMANVCARLRILAQMVFSAKKEGEKELTLVHDKDEWKNLRSQLRTFGLHNKLIRFVSKERNHRCHCRDTGLECITYLSLTTPNLEHLEVDMLSHVLTDTFFQTMTKFPNLKTLKVYSVYNCSLAFSFGIIKKLTELIWGYPAIFSVSDLLTLITTGTRLERLIVICHSGIYAVDDQYINADIYRKMLDVISNRAHKKPLHVIIMGCESFMRRFHVAFPTHDSLKITCVKKKTVASCLNVEVMTLNCDIKINAEAIAKLQAASII